MATNGNGRAGMRKLRRLVKGIRVAMMTTTTEDGSLHSRPMATSEALDEGGSLWFFTSCETEKVREINADHRVNVTYSDPDDDRYVAITGKAELIRDREKMKELWSPLLRAWFPRGLDEPDIALLRVDVERAEYWDPTAGVLSAIVSRVRRAVTGSPGWPAKHGRIDLSHGAHPDAAAQG
jgi:general stress protein 26